MDTLLAFVSLLQAQSENAVIRLVRNFYSFVLKATCAEACSTQLHDMMAVNYKNLVRATNQKLRGKLTVKNF